MENAQGNELMDHAGSAYTFQKNASGNWEQIDKITTSSRNAGDYFGEKVAISGNTIICSAHSDDEDVDENNFMNNAGGAFLFKISCAPETFASFHQTQGGCREINYNGNFYTESQIIVDTFYNSFYENCDTFIYTELIIFPLYETTIDTFLMPGENLTIGNNTYSMSGTYVDTLTSFNGCDVIV